jgi:ribose-phosphate pyrophosphokinase
MTALFMLTQYFADLGLEDLVVVAPDAGRVKLNKKFAAEIGADLAILNKERPAQQVAAINYVIGDVAGKTAVLVDDIIDTAGTLKAAAEAVYDAGATRVYAAATHGVFSGQAWENRGSVRADRRHRHAAAAGRSAGKRARPLLRGPADQLDPPDLHRRLGE